MASKSKQLELRYTVHRCKWCQRELRKKVSIQRRAGPKCYRMEVELDKLTRR